MRFLSRPRKNSLHRSLGLLLIAATLSACTHVPLTSLPALSRIDFASTQFGGLYTALRLPEQVQVDPEGMEMRAVLKREGFEPETDLLPLQPIQDPRLTRLLTKEQQAGTTIYVFGLTQEGERQMNEIREHILAGKEEGRKGSLSLTVTPKLLCRTGVLASDDLVFDSYLMTSETGRFVPTARNVSLVSILEAHTGDVVDVNNVLPQCAPGTHPTTK